MLSSVFVPLFGVILGRLAFGVPAATLLSNAPAVNVLPVVIWLAGIAMYHLSSRYTPVLGAALPTLLLTFAVGWLSRPPQKA
jgi:hypothetical protein